MKEKGYTQVKAHAKKLRKQHEADVRQAKYEALSTEEKIELVQSRGGSQRELARLTKTPLQKLAASPSTIPVVSLEPKAPAEKPKRTRKSDVVKVAKAARPSKS